MQIEFLPDESDDGSRGARLSEGVSLRRRLPPPWTWLVAVAAVTSVVAALVTTRGGASRHAAPDPTPTISISSSPAPIPSSLPLALDAPALAIAMSGRTTWILQADRLTALDDLATVRASAKVSLGLGPDDTVVLLLDPGFVDLWVVVDGTTSGRAIEFDTFRLKELRDVRLGTISSAATMGGHLYVTSVGQLIDIAPGAAPRTIPETPTERGGFGPVVADPTRSRLLVLDYGYPTHVWTYSPIAGLARSTETLPFGKGSVAVVDGQIWAGGFGESGAQLLHLDPSGISPVDISPLNGALSPGAVIVASGQSVFWVRAGGGGDDLWCVDAASGRPAQHWNLSGVVASSAGSALISSISGASALQLNGCAG